MGQRSAARLNQAFNVEPLKDTQPHVCCIGIDIAVVEPIDTVIRNLQG